MSTVEMQEVPALTPEMTEWLGNLAFVVIETQDVLKRRMPYVIASISRQVNLIPGECLVLEEIGKNTGFIFVKDDDCDEYIFLATYTKVGVFFLIKIIHISTGFDCPTKYLVEHLFKKILGRLGHFSFKIPENLAHYFLGSPGNELVATRDPETNLMLLSTYQRNAFIPLVMDETRLKNYELDSKHLKELFCDKEFHSLEIVYTLATTKYQFLEMIVNLRSSYIDKLFIHFSGKAFNGKGTDFPAITFSDREKLLQPELANLLRSWGFSLTIVGYDCGNYSPRNSVPALIPGIELPVCDLIERNELLTESKKCKLSAMMNYTGELYFSATSPGQKAYSFVDLGSCFTNKLINSLYMFKSDWILSLNRVSVDPFFKPYGMKPFYVGNLIRQSK